MEINFTAILQPLMNKMAFDLAIFVFGTLFVLGLAMGLMSILRFPRFIKQPAIALLAIGCMYYWSQNFL